MGAVAISLVCALSVGGFFVSGISVSEPVRNSDIWRELPTAITESRDIRKTIQLTAEVRPYLPATVVAECYLKCRILEMLPEGSQVAKGDVVMRLDGNELEERMRDRELKLIKYQNLVARAVAQEKILETTNQRTLSTAIFKAQSAEHKLEAWEQAEFSQLITEANDDCKIAREALVTEDDEYQYIRHLAKDGVRSWRDVERAGYGRERARREVELAIGRRSLLRDFDAKSKLAALSTSSTLARNNVFRTELKSSLALTNARLLTMRYQRTSEIYRNAHERYKTAFEACVVTAPADGEVSYSNSWSRQSRGSKYIEIGKEVRRQQSLFSVIDRRQQKIKGRISDRVAGSVAEGCPVEFTVAGYDEVRQGHVSWVSPISFARSSYTPHLRDHWVEILIDEAPDRIAELSPRQDVDVTILIDSRSAVLQVPVDAVMEHDDEMVVLLKTREGTQRQPVTIGQTTDATVEIVDGLNAGDEVYLAESEQLRELASTLP